MATQADQNAFLRQILRQFEHALIEELGYPLDYQSRFNAESNIKQSALSVSIRPMVLFLFHIPLLLCWQGSMILCMQYYEKGSGIFNSEQLQLLTKLYRQND